MSVNIEQYEQLKKSLGDVVLVAVSKTKPNEDIQSLYDMGQRDFGENYVQELIDKQVSLPADIRWHFIGHLQSNKVKYIAPLVYLIHGVDSISLLKEINKQAIKNNRIIDCLLQVHIAQEETKFGMDEAELIAAIPLSKSLPSIRLRGLMGMASFTEDTEKVQKEFKVLKGLFDKYKADTTPEWSIISMGMSGDYALAMKEGSTMVRIGSLLFGAR
jgi:pyridoxal phosphate enzyme (YggS family)